MPGGYANYQRCLEIIVVKTSQFLTSFEIFFDWLRVEVRVKRKCERQSFFCRLKVLHLSSEMFEARFFPMRVQELAPAYIGFSQPFGLMEPKF